VARVTDGLPDALWRGGHVKVGDAEVADGVDDGVPDGGVAAIAPDSPMPLAAIGLRGVGVCVRSVLKEGSSAAVGMP
jgi:hypothetical protein